MFEKMFVCSLADLFGKFLFPRHTCFKLFERLAVFLQIFPGLTGTGPQIFMNRDFKKFPSFRPAWECGLLSS
ncbi:hypothetical protein STRDD11_00725 [Streptococcus sp. DD11]|nr:hypothetical protein STRDD11_00725 [Streptococcus sp. DD11]